MELNEQTNSWIDEQSYKDEFERVEQFKKTLIPQHFDLTLFISS